jgi:Arc/MetJ family transcription regulator
MNVEFEVDLDDELVAELMRSTGITDVNELVRQGLLELIDRERLRRSAKVRRQD